MGLTALAAVLLVCLGLLLGVTWTAQALQHKHRQLAEERRWLNEQWLMIRTARRLGLDEPHGQAGTRCRCYQHKSEENPMEDD
ncbi:MAG TPA: hypothetical protein VGP04_20540 [Pseudonocardiaceae bacterium]|nr:hypothetical protein [Pseudonocardiaceae bacterium]